MFVCAHALNSNLKVELFCVCVLKATHPGLLKISGLQEGVYTFQMTVTDTGGQKSSDNVSVTVLAPKHQAEGDISSSSSSNQGVPEAEMCSDAFVCPQCAQVTAQTTSSSVMTAAVLTSPTPVMGSSTVRTALTKTSAQTVRNISFQKMV